LIGALGALLASACSTRATTDASNPDLFQSPAGEALAFGSESGGIQNYFLRQGSASVHVLTRGGVNPRLIFAFPAENQGIGLWFSEAPEGTRLWAGSDDGPASERNTGELTALRSAGRAGQREAFGVRATLHSDARTLSVELALLANIRSLRDYGGGVCLEDAARFPELRNETVELDAEHNLVHLRRAQIGGERALDLSLQGRSGTELSLRQALAPARPGCEPRGAPAPRRFIDIQSAGPIELDVVALSDEDPLTPIESGALLSVPASDPSALAALGFLAYEEKLEAGSWRFLSYFGRDTLLSLDLLLPALQRGVAEAGLGAVLERINLAPSASDPSFGAIEVGDVAHEEAIGDYAAWQNSQQQPPPADLRTPRYDYKMVDDDFLLAPVLARYVAERDAAGEAAAVEALLSRMRADGRSYRDALVANLALVLERARPFAEDPAPAASKRGLLVALKPNVPVGEWRDSNQGIAFGRFAFDVNAALVPGALEAAAALYQRLGSAEDAARAERYRLAWRDVEALFRVDLPLTEARANVAAFARSAGLRDTSTELGADATGSGGVYSYYGIALDAGGNALPVEHTDHGFVMAFSEPSDEYLVRVAATLGADFPAGLVSPVGVIVASAALAPPDYTLTDPKDLTRPDDDVTVRLADLFTPADYHGTVVWSWQQALLASGVRRQLERTDIGDSARSALAALECKLWAVIDATKSVRSAELWSYQPGPGGVPEYRAFGDDSSDADESNAIQLWSTVYLAVQPPTAAQNPLCSAAAEQ
jgi:hypothetical protein